MLLGLPPNLIDLSFDLLFPTLPEPASQFPVILDTLNSLNCSPNIDIQALNPPPQAQLREWASELLLWASVASGSIHVQDMQGVEARNVARRSAEFVAEAFGGVDE